MPSDIAKFRSDSGVEWKIILKYELNTCQVTSQNLGVMQGQCTTFSFYRKPIATLAYKPKV